MKIQKVIDILKAYPDVELGVVTADDESVDSSLMVIGVDITHNDDGEVFVNLRY